MNDNATPFTRPFDRCPKCGNRELDYASPDREADELHQLVICQNCGMEWYNNYQFINSTSAQDGYTPLDKDGNPRSLSSTTIQGDSND